MSSNSSIWFRFLSRPFTSLNRPTSHPLCRAKPAQQVDIQVRTKPNAFVAVLGVDQSLLMLADGHDVRREDVVKELASYDSVKVDQRPAWYRRRRRRSLQWISALTAGEILDSSGVIILTDAKVHRYSPNSEFSVFRWSSSVVGPAEELPPAPTTLTSDLFRRTAVYYRMNGPMDAADFDRTAPAAGADRPAPGDGADGETPVRRHFPDTWIWASKTAG